MTGEFVLAALDLLEYFIGLFGDLDDRVGQLFLRVVRAAGGCAKDRLGSFCDLVGYIDGN